jgi:ribosome maturation factor RimP
MESTQLWSLIESTVHGCGLELFDVELPKGRNGTLRIFLSVPETASLSGESSARNVTLDQCATVSKRLDQDPGFEPLLPEGCIVEVSSPGINRKLRRPEHYRGAVGERVKVKFGSEADAENTDKGLPGSIRVVRGKLAKFDGQVLEIDDEERHELVRMGLGQVREAQVDFLFDEV